MIRRLLTFILALGGIAVLAIWLFPRQLSEQVFTYAMGQIFAGVGQSGETEQGIQIYLCGTGSPIPDPVRSGPCMGVIAGGRVLVFDPGEGAARKLATMQFPLARTERIVVTHLHSDHIDGLGGILLQAWIGGGRDTPLTVNGPQGIERVVAGVNEMFAIDATYRTAHHGFRIANPKGYGAIAEPVTLQDDGIVTIFEDDSLSLRAVEVSHSPAEPAMGVRIDHRGQSVSFSGDTLFDPRFVALSEGVDMMIHDAMQNRMVKQMADAVQGRPGAEILHKILTDIPTYHASPEDAARAAAQAGAGAQVLTHIAPPLPTKLLYPAFLGGARALYSGPITIGEDGMILRLELR